MFKHSMVHFEFQKTLEKDDQAPGEMSATFGKYDERIYEHQLRAEIDNKYRIYDCHYTGNEERTYCRGRSLDQEDYLRSPVPTTPPREASLSSSMSFTQPLPRSNNASGSLDRLPHRSSKTEIAWQMGAVALRKKERETRAVFHDYGDGIRETYEIESSASFQPTTQRDGRKAGRWAAKNGVTCGHFWPSFCRLLVYNSISIIGIRVEVLIILLRLDLRFR
jgi:hypothetical protein